VHAQEGTVSSGGNANGNNGTVSYSVGQMNYEQRESLSGSVSEGLQQVWEISVLSGIEQKNILLDVNIYPNPVAEKLILKINDAYPDQFSYGLMSADGRMVDNKQVLKAETELDVTNLTTGMYLFTIYSKDEVLKVFRVIKNKNQ